MRKCLHPRFNKKSRPQKLKKVDYQHNITSANCIAAGSQSHNHTILEEKQVALGVLKAQSATKCEEIINLAQDEQKAQPRNVDEGKWQTQKNKRTHKKTRD
ncbi:hypothetical protein JTB14_004457 [Gonioctena quinquepunctata]|nr:hypothetical protein JTB14_004457 [Gonioctena quinquepunctata]